MAWTYSGTVLCMRPLVMSILDDRPVFATDIRSDTFFHRFRTQPDDIDDRCQIFSARRERMQIFYSVLFVSWLGLSAAHYQWHIDWRIWNIVPIESGSYSIFPRGIRLIVPMRCTLFADMLIVSMFAAMPHIAMVICLGLVVQRRRRRRLNA